MEFRIERILDGNKILIKPIQAPTIAAGTTLDRLLALVFHGGNSYCVPGKPCMSDILWAFYVKYTCQVY